MASSTEVGWRPATFNQGWAYADRVDAPWASAAAFYAARYPHSSLEDWQERLAGGEIHRNGHPLGADGALVAGDRLVWHRPPWREGAVPATWAVVHDDGDLLVIDKPSGLPVLPAGGWLEHTALRLLERRHASDPAGVPRPVHRLGRFTSGLLVCARRPESRRWLSARLRESTAHQEGGVGCRKVYQALLVPGGLPPALAPGEPLTLDTPIGRRPHPRLGRIWCAALEAQPGDLAARSTLRLLERTTAGDRVEITIASGRPHQIRIHCAALGAPLLGDPLYASGGQARADALPGDGGYRLRAQRLAIQRPDGSFWRLDAGGERPMPG
ncbi:MAG: RluA family pseudouridine synthase [Cyanobacteriota bacterium]|jgi:23S rRNA pseudouridine1911/1915/1917 synthase|nr:RluA family pseudouridine synthase [Cyanobacteriota bacterium]